ncbi:MAG TPA: hypothetical protein PLG15_02070 [Candidatus Gastranaerophilaceae bacterium]|nr:hypothetical protein [Candidatus Gastranaerophilaceae bacterium]HPT41151.1 hypothetical protein [Candidatus Gastranaerophilaceae bacterium]
MKVNIISYQTFMRKKPAENKRQNNEPLHFPIMLNCSDLSKEKAKEQYRILQNAIIENKQEKALEIIKHFEKLPKNIQSCIPIVQNDNNENIFILAVKNNQPKVALKVLDFVKTLPEKAKIDFAFIRGRNNENQSYIAGEYSQRIVRDAFGNFVKTLPKDIQTITYQYYGPRQYYNDSTAYGDDLDW